MKNFVGSQRFLAFYSGALTLVVALALFAAAARSGKTRFEEIDVQRINLVEPDGTVKLVLSNKALFPGILYRGKEYPHPNRKTAGILFLNDEGTENGGLIFGGSKDAKGNVSSYGHLSFDRYNQDQVFTIDASEESGRKEVALSVVDRPDYSLEELLLLEDKIRNLPGAQQKAEVCKFLAQRESPHPRLFLGRSEDGSVSLRLNDPKGRGRLILEVTADGSPVVRFLDENGKETGRVPAAKEEK